MTAWYWKIRPPARKSIFLTGRREGEAFLFRLQPQYDDATSRGRAEFAEVMSLTHRTAGGLPPYELAFFDSGGGHIASYTN